MRNLYKTLGVNIRTSQDDIKKAYRKLAKDLHPDLNMGNDKIAERFKEVSAAYSILSDDAQRSKYDRGEIDENGANRPRGFNKSNANSSGYGNAGSSSFYGKYDGTTSETTDDTNAFGFDFTDSEDQFSEFFGSKKKKEPKEKRSSIFRRPKRKGLDIAYEVTVGFEEAVTGSTRRLTLNDGRSVDIKIPLGIRDGQVIRLNGQGGPGIAGGDKGDALVEIRVAEHPIYKRDGNDIYMRVPISLDEAVLGCDIEVPTPHGRLTVRVPRGTSTGKSLRLKGKGVRKKGSEGNMYMNLEVMLPKTRDVELEKLIKDWSGGDGPALRKKSGI